MINFDAVDISKRRSEEVISFFDAECIYILAHTEIRMIHSLEKHR